MAWACPSGLTCRRVAHAVRRLHAAIDPWRDSVGKIALDAVASRALRGGRFCPPYTSRSLRTHDGARNRDIAGQRRRERKYREVAFAHQRIGEQFVILPALHLGRPEGLEMLGDELGIEQLESTG